jgi:hypothetical protein
MLDYSADNRRFGRFGFQTEERSLAMKRRDTVYKALCGVGILALVVPFVVWAAVFSLLDLPYPSGGSGPPLVESFTWWWMIDNNGSQSISANVNTENARFRREIPWWPDETVWETGWQQRFNSSIPPGMNWTDSRFENRGYSGMLSGNKYHWDWQAWNANASDGSSGSRSGGTGGTYNCN